MDRHKPPTQAGGWEERTRGIGKAEEEGDDDDVQMIREQVLIREDEGEGLPEGGDGYRTPRGKR